MAPWLWAQLCLFTGGIDMSAGRPTDAVYVVAVHPCARFRSIKRTLYAKFDAGSFSGLVWVFMRGELNRYSSMERYRARPVNNLVNIRQEELALTIKIGAGV
jgi:hypothetical protein